MIYYKLMICCRREKHPPAPASSQSQPLNFPSWQSLTQILFLIAHLVYCVETSLQIPQSNQRIISFPLLTTIAYTVTLIDIWLSERIKIFIWKPFIISINAVDAFQQKASISVSNSSKLSHVHNEIQSKN